MDILSLLKTISIKGSIAIITLFTGFIIAKLAGKLTKKILFEAEINRILQAAGFRPLREELARLVEYTIYIITIFAVLRQFGITRIITDVIILLAILMIIISLLLTTRQFIPNAITGLMIRKKLKKYEGKIIKIGMIKGKLEEIGITSSKIINKQEHYIPHVYTRKYLKQFRAN